MPTIADITGLWRRSLIRWPDGRSDTTTSVRWMQTPTLFVDLRQPSHRPSFAGVTCLSNLRRDQVAWLAGQEGFAGEIHFDGTFFEWQRQIDLQPIAAFPDAGRFWFEKDVMVEEGRDVPYIEHWHREASGAEPCAGIRMHEVSTGRLGIVVRCGDLFMYARRRAGEMPARGRLIDCVAGTADLSEAQDLVDCEISYGRVEAGGWRIERSSLPYKENQMLGLRLDESRNNALRTLDAAPKGGPMDRHWEIVDVQGELSDVVGGVAA